MFNTSIDAAALVANLSDVEKRQFPFAVMQTLNEAAFEVRKGWEKEIPAVFDRPVPLTQRAVQYRKATKQTLVAEVFLRNEADKGLAPVKYLAPEVEGGPRAAKRSEVLLRRAGVLGPGEFAAPAEDLKLDEFGNIPGTLMRTILSDVQATADPLDRSNRKSRKRRSRRKDPAKRWVYFYNRAKRGNLPRGIFRRMRESDDGKIVHTVEGVLFPIPAPDYDKRYRVFDLAQRLFPEAFTRLWPGVLARAVANAKRKA